MRCSSVSVLRRRLAGRPRNSGSILCRGKRLISSHKCLDQLVPCTASCRMVPPPLYPVIKCLWCGSDTSDLVPKLRMRGPIPQFPHTLWRDPLFITGTAVLRSLTSYLWLSSPHSCHYWIRQRASFYIYIKSFKCYLKSYEVLWQTYIPAVRVLLRPWRNLRALRDVYFPFHCVVWARGGAWWWRWSWMIDGP